MSKINYIFASFIAMIAWVSAANGAPQYYAAQGMGFADTTGQISIIYPTASGESATESGIWVGEIKMWNSETGQFGAFCLSPAGRLYLGSNSLYERISLADAGNGNNPAAWSENYGIENAYYLWTHHDTLANNDDGAALNLAMWAALYNSTDLGKINGTRFSVSGISDATRLAYDHDLSLITNASQGDIGDYYLDNPGYLLRPVDSTQQDLIFSAPSIQAGPIPEPSSVMSIAFIALLSLGKAMKGRKR